MRKIEMRRLELQHELDVLEAKELEMDQTQVTAFEQPLAGSEALTKMKEDEDGQVRRPVDDKSIVIDLTADE